MPLLTVHIIAGPNAGRTFMKSYSASEVRQATTMVLQVYHDCPTEYRVVLKKEIASALAAPFASREFCEMAEVLGLAELVRLFDPSPWAVVAWAEEQQNAA